MHTIFRIREIKSLGEKNRLWQVELTLTSDNDKDLRVLTDRIREETFPDSEGWYRLGSLLLKMGQPDKAQQVYEVMLGQASDKSEKAPIYNQLGWIKDEQGQYEEAITYYEKDLEISQRTLPPTHIALASSYNNIGEAYRKMGEYSKALSYYEKALDIQQKTLPPTHPSLAISYYNIGIVYDSMGEYPKAVLSYQRAVNIGQQSLPKDHPDLKGSRKALDLAKKKL
jgi:tetratricopeptide (TPR) repeat protein